jgi:hypothetical protein
MEVVGVGVVESGEVNEGQASSGGVWRGSLVMVWGVGFVGAESGCLSMSMRMRMRMIAKILHIN